MVPLSKGSSGSGGSNGGSSDGAATGQLHDAMTFIDFEYAEWAPRGHDLGNHFCE